MCKSKFVHNHVLFLSDCVFDELRGRVTCTICLPPDLKTTGTDNLREWIPTYVGITAIGEFTFLQTSCMRMSGPVCRAHAVF